MFYAVTTSAVRSVLPHLVQVESVGPLPGPLHAVLQPHRHLARVRHTEAQPGHRAVVAGRDQLVQPQPRRPHDVGVVARRVQRRGCLPRPHPHAPVLARRHEDAAAQGEAVHPLRVRHHGPLAGLRPAVPALHAAAAAEAGHDAGLVTGEAGHGAHAALLAALEPRQPRLALAPAPAQPRDLAVCGDPLCERGPAPAHQPHLAEVHRGEAAQDGVQHRVHAAAV